MKSRAPASVEDRRGDNGALLIGELSRRSGVSVRAIRFYERRGVLPAASRTHAGREEDLEFAKGWRRAFPDGAYTIEKLVAEGDLVAVYWTARGTNTGEGNSLPATGKTIDITGVTLLKIVDGLIVEEWNVYDQLGLYRQLGLMGSKKKPENP